MKEFRIGATSDKLWNKIELLDFLSKNQFLSIVIRVSPEAICLKNLGLYDILDCFDFEKVNIFTENPLESHSHYNIIIQKDNPWLKKQEKINKDLHTWNTKKLFFCLFGRPTAARLGIAGHLYKNFKSIAHIHFSAKTDADNLIQFELDKLLSYDTASIATSGEMINQLPLLLAPSDYYTPVNGYYYSDPLTDFYQDTLIDIVVESHVAGNTFYPTEKTTRPIWLKKPFIVFASRNYLDYLHQMGFHTFCKYWSEDYDGYEGRDRYIKILQLIDDLAKKSQCELERMYQDMQTELEHNYSLLYNQSYQTNISYIP